jgi:hypothetical protein
MISVKNQLPASALSFLDMKAQRIKALAMEWSKNTVAIGRELKQARDRFPIVNSNHRPGWHDWIRKETGLSAEHAIRFIRIAERFGQRAAASGLSWKVLDFLSRDTTPAEATNAVLDLAMRGDKITPSRAREIAREHLPTRAEAIKLARETGRLVTARDGFMYSGASEDEMAAYSLRRTVVFGIERAFNHIADCDWSPKEWVARAEDHWVSDLNLGKLDAAIDFLTKLRPLLEKRQKVVRP